MWVESVVDSLHCSEIFFSRYSGFPLTSKTNISKFQFDQEQQMKNHFEDELPIKHHFYILFKRLFRLLPTVYREWPLLNSLPIDYLNGSVMNQNGCQTLQSVMYCLKEERKQKDRNDEQQHRMNVVWQNLKSKVTKNQDEHFQSKNEESLSPQTCKFKMMGFTLERLIMGELYL